MAVCHAGHEDGSRIAAAAIRVCAERPEDLKDIRAVNERAFRRDDEAGLVEALRRNGKLVVSLVALCNRRIVGHIAFSPVTIVGSEGACAALGLAPMAVLPEYQRRGIGSRLVAAGLEECRRAGHERIVVLRHAEHYPRFGFLPASRFGVTCEYDVPDGVFMAVELRTGAFGHCRGTAKFAPEFRNL